MRMMIDDRRLTRIISMPASSRMNLAIPNSITPAPTQPSMRQRVFHTNVCPPSKDFAQIHQSDPSQSFVNDLVLHANSQQREGTNPYSEIARLCCPHPATKTSSNTVVILNSLGDLPAILRCLTDPDHSLHAVRKTHGLYSKDIISKSPISTAISAAYLFRVTNSPLHH
jgi:hypothetical protein